MVLMQVILNGTTANCRAPSHSAHLYFCGTVPAKVCAPLCLPVRILASVTVATLLDSAGSSPIAFNHPGRPPKLRKKRGWSVLDGASRASFCVLAVPLHWQSCTRSRCVGFSWAKPSVTKRSTHPGVRSVKPHWKCSLASQEARLVCLGRSKPRFILRLSGSPTLAVLRVAPLATGN